MIERLLCLADKFFLPNPLIYKTNPRKSVFIFGGKGGGSFNIREHLSSFFPLLSLSLCIHTHTQLSLCPKLHVAGSFKVSFTLQTK